MSVRKAQAHTDFFFFLRNYIFVDYDKLINAPNNITKQLSQTLNLSWGKRTNDIINTISYNVVKTISNPKTLNISASLFLIYSILIFLCAIFS